MVYWADWHFTRKKMFYPFWKWKSIFLLFQYLELRFGPTTRKCVTIIFILVNCFFLPVIMYIPSLSFVEGKTRNSEQLNLYWLLTVSIVIPVSKLNIHVVNTIMCYICVFYTMSGGIQAVVWTDVCLSFTIICLLNTFKFSNYIHFPTFKVLQGTVMIVSVMIVALFGIYDVGGLNVIWDRAVNGSRITAPEYDNQSHCSDSKNNQRRFLEIE